MRSLMPRSASRSFSRSVSGVAARSALHSSRLNVEVAADASTRPTLRMGRRSGATALLTSLHRRADSQAPRGVVHAAGSRRPRARHGARARAGGRGPPPTGCASSIRRAATVGSSSPPPTGRRRFGTVPDGCLTGIDIDPGAAWPPPASPSGRRDVRAGDALDGAVPAVPFDVVVGNPPFLNQLAADTSRGGRSRWGGGPYADTAALFLSLALQPPGPTAGGWAWCCPTRSSPRATRRPSAPPPSPAPASTRCGGRAKRCSTPTC